MQHPFEVLRAEYETLLARMLVTRQHEVDQVAHRLLTFVNEGKYTEVSAKTGVPIVWMATSFEREASSNFRLSPAQGDPLDEISTHVPKGLGPYAGPIAWQQAAEDAYRIDGLDRVGAANWTAARACFEGEIFNGMGYRQHGIHSPYLWAGTNNYSAGKYTSDGHFDPSAVDQQLGIVPVMLRMIELQSSLAFVMAPQAAPEGVGQNGEHDTTWVQHALNVLKIDSTPLIEDNNYGRATRRVVTAYQKHKGIAVDGFAGPVTVAALEKDISEIPA